MTETKMRLEDWLDDLCVRFIINLPREELESVERICFQVEEAQWFYEDFVRPLDPVSLPSLPLKAFALRIFQHCPLMSQWSNYHHQTAFSEFLAYKTRVPVRGAILLNQEMDEVVLVKGWKKGANWSFPRGKINKDEKDLDCAIREVYEETGYDIREAGLVPDEKEVKAIEITMREQHMKLFVFRGVPRDTHFEPRTRKEISKIEWYKLSDLPTLKNNKHQDPGFAQANTNKFYMVAPFMHPLKKWIAYRKRLDAKTNPQQRLPLHLEEPSADDENWSEGEPRGRSILPSYGQFENSAAADHSIHKAQRVDIDRGSPFAHAPSALAPHAAQTPGTDPSKSNALLELLRRGAPQDSNQGPPSAPQAAPGPNQAELPTYPAPMFPGFPPQGAFQYCYPQPPSFPPPPHGPAASMPPPDAFMPQPSPSRMTLPVGPHGLGPAYSGLPTYPQESPSAPSPQRVPMPAGPHAPPPSHAPAPFQRTGDPEFSHSAQLPQSQSATIPPARNLPPPRLDSHAMALLNVFKDESSKTPKTTPARLMPSPGKEALASRKPSQHQDQLLSLLKGKPTPARSTPAELAAPTVSSPPKQILQRPRTEASPAKQSYPTHKPDTWTSATVSGPLNMPQLGPGAKTVGKSSPGGSTRKGSARVQPIQSPASPITILSRPQAAKPEHPSGPDQSRAPRTPPQSGRNNKPKPVEPAKPFQPQILRRSANVDNIFPAYSKETTHGPQNVPSTPHTSQEPKTEVSFDRRPSQTAAQRETLLSLFGKVSGSPGASPAVQPVLEASTSKLSAASSVVSPLSPPSLPTGIVATSESSPRDGAVSSGVSGIASPDNKAFLLGFLQGVAKGSK